MPFNGKKFRWNPPCFRKNRAFQRFSLMVTPNEPIFQGFFETLIALSGSGQFTEISGEE
jgi:hypothetical protein